VFTEVGQTNTTESRKSGFSTVCAKILRKKRRGRSAQLPSSHGRRGSGTPAVAAAHEPAPALPSLHGCRHASRRPPRHRTQGQGVGVSHRSDVSKPLSPKAITRGRLLSPRAAAQGSTATPPDSPADLYFYRHCVFFFSFPPPTHSISEAPASQEELRGRRTSLALRAQGSSTRARQENFSCAPALLLAGCRPPSTLRPARVREGRAPPQEPLTELRGRGRTEGPGPAAPPRA